MYEGCSFYVQGYRQNKAVKSYFFLTLKQFLFRDEGNLNSHDFPCRNNLFNFFTLFYYYIRVLHFLLLDGITGVSNVKLHLRFIYDGVTFRMQALMLTTRN